MEMLSTRLNTMLMATSNASMTSVRTEVLRAELRKGYTLLNPGSVSIPKEGNPPTYAIYEDGVFSIKDFEGNIVKSIGL